MGRIALVEHQINHSRTESSLVPSADVSGKREIELADSRFARTSRWAIVGPETRARASHTEPLTVFFVERHPSAG